ncbi:MAG: hemerythrin family protein [Clostridium sp.]|nr:hemerythrin family protein [Acetatifactor muris]MCM1527686.1 hemerythrin family protein [Bacteroides sp.]MCM1563370.1 hemerythrin family protein [Clostridium sp.]
MYEFKDEFLTGIEEIDREHRKLFEIADELYDLKCEEFIPDKYDNIKKILGELKDYTLTHFEHEEAYMQSIGYKRMFTQKSQHDALKEIIGSWDLEAIDENQDDAIEEMLKVVTDWLTDHILEQDKLIGK